MATRVLITGGAGYVGSHCARHLIAQGYEVVVVDDLSTGYREAVSGELVTADLRDREALRQLLGRGFDAVLHFAARMMVGESVTDPLGYYDSNVVGTHHLLEAMTKAGCRRLVFSSTCAVYGVPSRVPIDESTPFAPISPYGATKATVENMLGALRANGQLDAVSLRYFNAAGAAEDASIGEAHVPETHLIPVALEAAVTGRAMTVFGTDHPTPDGTCVRDYVHVDDLARAHQAALERLLEGRGGGAWNLGSGVGYSVREVLDTVERVTGRAVARTYGPARTGDPPALVADTRASAADLGWRAKHDLERIVTDAWRWHQAPRFG